MDIKSLLFTTGVADSLSTGYDCSTCKMTFLAHFLPHSHIVCVIMFVTQSIQINKINISVCDDKTTAFHLIYMNRYIQGTIFLTRVYFFLPAINFTQRTNVVLGHFHPEITLHYRILLFTTSSLNSSSHGYLNIKNELPR